MLLLNWHDCRALVAIYQGHLLLWVRIFAIENLAYILW